MSTEEQATRHRNPDGTFASGNKFGKGRPRKERRQYLDVMFGEVDIEAWTAIVDTATSTPLASAVCLLAMPSSL